MPTATKTSPFISSSVDEAVRTEVDTVSPISSDFEHKLANRKAWQSLIDHKLIEWGRNPEQFDDEGVEAPSGETIRLAIGVAQACWKEEFPPPDSVVPDASGGIVFERREKDVSEVFHVWDDGTIEYQRFHGTRLIERRPS